MRVFTSSGRQVDSFPQDLDLYGFFFEYWPALRPDLRGMDVPLLIDDDTGRSLTLDEIHSRTDALALGLHAACALGDNSTLALVSPNSPDYLPTVLATHRIGATLTPVNPNLSVGELTHQLRTCGNVRVIFVSDVDPTRDAVLQAAHELGIPKGGVVLVQSTRTVHMQGQAKPRTDGHWTLDGLVEYGQSILRKEGTKALEKSRFRLGNTPNSTRTALLSFSSGTSGLPKGVKISHLNVIANILQHTAHMRIPGQVAFAQRRAARVAPPSTYEPGTDRVFGALPFFHIYGCVVVLSTSVWTGLGVVCVPRFRGTEALLASTARHRITHWYLVPPILIKLVKEDSVRERFAAQGQLASLKHVLSGAAPLKDELARTFMRKFPGVQIGQGYGMTETCATVLMSPIDRPYVLGSAGVVLANTEARVVRSDGSDAGDGEPGELWVRGPQVTMGYLNNEKESNAAYLPGGWYRTGDEVIVDSTGHVFVVDRLKEMIKNKGYQIAPAELEGLLLDSADVLDVGVVGVPDDECGELPVAFVSLSADAQARVQQAGRQRAALEEQIAYGLMELVRANKVRYKHLAGIIIVPEVPKNPSGKILRKQLRKLLATALPAMIRAPPSHSPQGRSRL